MNFLQRILNLFSPNQKVEEEDPEMKYLIVGIGNMGAKYDNTRHNVGFEVLDHIAKKNELKFEHESLGDLTKWKTKGRTFVLLKPSTYVNLSGKAVRYWMQKEKINKEKILIVLDDLNLDFGKIRMRAKGKDGGHNGLKNIDQILGGNNYARLRIGIGNDYKRGKQVDFVLGEWDKDEQEALPEIIENTVKKIVEFGTVGFQHMKRNKG
ncbi:MAG: aminoacyl-tRNA hydrolase [Bacteroidota bacterium]